MNTTLEETSSLIVYNGNSWNKNDPNSLYHDGTQADSGGENDTAVFAFTGVAIYYFVALWPFNVSTILTLDDQPSITLNLTDPSVGELDRGPPTVQSAIRWSQTNLTNQQQHTLTVSRGSHVLMDALIFTTDDDSDSSSSGSSSTPSITSSSTRLSATSQSLAPTSSHSNRGAVIGGSVAAMSIIAALLIVVWLRRQKRHRKNAAKGIDSRFADPESARRTIISPFPQDTSTERPSLSQTGVTLSRKDVRTPFGFSRRPNDVSVSEASESPPPPYAKLHL